MSNTATSNDSGDGSGTSGSKSSNNTTIIVLATLMSIVGALLIAGAVLACIRCRRRRSKLFSRGITPIDDEEIETWKGNRVEKGLGDGAELTTRSEGRQGHQKHESVSSTKKPPSLIVYNRQSEERFQPRSPPPSGGLHGKMSFDGPKMSIDKELPFTPIQARAPNAREGLTDETVPGDQPFIPSPKRQTSRLAKAHPRHPRQAHTRNKSSRSTISLNHTHTEGFHNGYESDAGMTYRASHDQQRYYPQHSGAQSGSSIPPRLSFSDDWPSSGGLSPRPSVVRREDIGRAIG